MMRRVGCRLAIHTLAIDNRSRLAFDPPQKIWEGNKEMLGMWARETISHPDFFKNNQGWTRFALVVTLLHPSDEHILRVGSFRCPVYPSEEKTAELIAAQADLLLTDLLKQIQGSLGEDPSLEGAIWPEYIRAKLETEPFSS